MPLPHPPPCPHLSLPSLHTQRRCRLALVSCSPTSSVPPHATTTTPRPGDYDDSISPPPLVPPHSTVMAPHHRLVPPYATTTTAPRPHVALTHLVRPPLVMTTRQQQQQRRTQTVSAVAAAAASSTSPHPRYAPCNVTMRRHRRHRLPRPHPQARHAPHDVTTCHRRRGLPPRPVRLCMRAESQSNAT